MSSSSISYFIRITSWADWASQVCEPQIGGIVALVCTVMLMLSETVWSQYVLECQNN